MRSFETQARTLQPLSALWVARTTDFLQGHCYWNMDVGQAALKVPFPTNFCDAATVQLTPAEMFSRFP